MQQHSDVRGAASRRRFLQTALGGVVVGIAAPRRLLEIARRGGVPDRLSPDGAIAALLAGNGRFVANQLTSPDRDLRVLRSRTVDKQEPFAAVLGCADSRVPVELVFDQSIGQLFVTRIAGNFVTPEIIASLEYAVAVLHVGAILVLGHSHCGAVTAAMKGEAEPGQISALFAPLRSAVTQGGGSLARAIAANARLQADLLRTSSTVIHHATSVGELAVAGGVYDLATGKVGVV
jgi:carbonic anhydrase